MQQDQVRIGPCRYVLGVLNQRGFSVVESHHAQNSVIANVKAGDNFIVGNAYWSAT
jgi:hypothetical protein